MKTGLTEELTQSIVDQILESDPNVYRIVLFGSRVTSQFTERSDIDVAIFSDELKWNNVAAIQTQLNQKISTPLKIDVVHFESLEKQALKEEIQQKGLVLYESRAI